MAETSPDPLRQLLAQLAAHVAEQVADRLGEGARGANGEPPHPEHVDPNRAYSDKEVCALLGGISRSTLYRIRGRGHLGSVELYEGGCTRTTGRQIIEYLRGRERAADVLNFTATGRKRSAA